MSRRMKIDTPSLTAEVSVPMSLFLFLSLLLSLSATSLALASSSVTAACRTASQISSAVPPAKHCSCSPPWQRAQWKRSCNSPGTELKNSTPSSLVNFTMLRSRRRPSGFNKEIASPDSTTSTPQGSPPTMLSRRSRILRFSSRLEANPALLCSNSERSRTTSERKEP